MKKNLIFIIIYLFIGLTFACTSTSGNENAGTAVVGSITARVIDNTKNIDQYYYEGIVISIENLGMDKKNLGFTFVYNSKTMENGLFYFSALEGSCIYQVSKITIPAKGDVPEIAIDLDIGSFVTVKGKNVNLGKLTYTVDLVSGKCTLENLGFDNIEEESKDFFINQDMYRDFPSVVELSISEREKIRRLNAFKAIFETFKFVEIPGQDYSMSETEVTEELYNLVFNNPTDDDEEGKPIANISWYDAIYFCNKFSQMVGKKPVYSVGGMTDVKQWNYKPHIGNPISGMVTQDENADGYRLPTEAEWEFAAKGGQDFKYSGSDILDEVAWYAGNSDGTVHPVAQKKANGYGLYDMSGNVDEWCWDSEGNKDRYYRGGSFSFADYYCEVDRRFYNRDHMRNGSLGFRIVCSSQK